jgi:hypothetical protein
METNEISDNNKGPTIVIIGGELWRSTMYTNLWYLKYVPHPAAERRIYNAA